MRPNDSRLADLMRAAQTGDRISYEELLGAIAPLVRRVIRRQQPFLSAEAVEDVVQDVLMSVHVVRASYDPGRPFTPWLLAITRNRLVDHARRSARVAAHEMVVDDLDVTFSSDAANPSMEADHDPEELRQAMASLPAGQRQAIELLKLQGLSLKEAAVASGTSVGALKVASHRGMTALKRLLNKT
jgi:RNA polymerase sigma factor (sigma-70 family)